MKYFLASLIVILLFSSETKPDFSGEWIYQYSVARGETVNQIFKPVNKKLFIDANDIPFLGQRIVFTTSKKEFKHFPETVQNLRKKNILFKDVTFRTFTKEGKTIDTFYPVDMGINDSLKIIYFTAYGQRIKEDYSLNYSQKDSLIFITDHIYYPHHGHEYSSVGHVYAKSR